jgi:hypothetical protein
MYRTKYGLHNGDTWEDLCQQIFKNKYGDDGYQEMVASPGDFGIEGFTRKTGLAFQCYCPEKQYTQEELYEKQRDKITKDLGKLKQYNDQLQARLGSTKIKEWIFITPDVNQNKILEHVQNKQEEVKDWGLSILDKNFIVLIRDADFYATEITHFQTINGDRLIFDDSQSFMKFYSKDNDLVDYEENIDRKNKIRCDYENKNNNEKLNKLNKLTVDKWFDGERLIRKIESIAPKVYYNLARVINQYEDEVSEMSISWCNGTEELIEKIKEGLFTRLHEEIPEMSSTDQRRIANHMIAKWIALCPLDFEQ